MTKKEFLENYHFSFNKPANKLHELEYAPKNDNTPAAVKRTRLNNTDYRSENDMRIALSQKLIIELGFNLEEQDVEHIFEADLEYKRIYGV
tara:strand:+ start:109 stop:381 length:273 start_codon:yes stop_codon:yes gene_type:complete